ncbi:N-acetylmuramoyl-L-alanine amidase [Aestuariivirga sp.]|uniref:N-acetylmuramoyl-L-alanine amidase n=1 Tax=Aestuariivirga sp. TaxID=2650926 RepID=UPI0025C05F36|nr:N-acetylmuramoyl-L-alanine amidase [Aestuariivirga sp.]
MAAARLLPVLFLAVLFLASGYRLPVADAADRSAMTVATAARVAGDKTRTRFVADLSAPVGYTVYVLANPYRVMIDLPQVSFSLREGAGDSTRGLVTQYRFGPVDDAHSRIVLDTDGPVLIDKAFLLKPKDGQPARIVVDIVRTTKQAFDARLAADAASATASAAPAVETPPGSGGAAPRVRKLVVIDPGHGGIDPGAIGLSNTREKDVVLAFGLKLKKVLEATGAIDVVMTRSDDTFLTLRDRVRIAREKEADLFIAIHADTVRGGDARGATIYTLSEKASDAEAEALAHKENRADIIAGVDLEAENQEVTDILIDLAQRESKTHSLVFARKAVAEMAPVTVFTGKPMRSAGFMVLKAADVPSVLIELGFLSSRQDESQLTSPEWQQKVAAAMGRAVETYFATQMAAKTP